MRAATWLTHLDFDWESPVWRHWLAELGDGHTLVRYDERGCGLSDRELGELSVETWVADLETVVDAAGVERFALLGVSQGAAIAIVYAARHPERVTRPRPLRRLRARPDVARRRGAPRSGGDDRRRSAPAGRTRTRPSATCSACCSCPHGTPEQMAWYDELQRRSTSAETAVRLYEARNEHRRGRRRAARSTAPTLVVHARGDRVVPVEEGRLLAARIPARGSSCWSRRTTSCSPTSRRGARSWPSCAPSSGTRAGARAPALSELSPRELEVLELVADGLTNEAIAERLS